MNDKSDSQTPAPLIACDICRKEVPLSAAFTPEGADYVHHFCGVDCYQQFVAETKELEENGGAAQS